MFKKMIFLFYEIIEVYRKTIECYVSIKASAQFFQLKATGTISSFGRHLTNLNMHDDPYFTKTCSDCLLFKKAT